MSDPRFRSDTFAGFGDAGAWASCAARVIGACRTLAAFSEAPGVTTRTFLSKPMRDVHAYLTAWMTDAGMRTRIDAAGNLRGVYPGARPEGPTLVLGSHLDTVPNGGAFDGVLGVASAIALVESLGHRRLPFHIEVVGFSEEEGVRFGTPFIGSLALAGALDEHLLAVRDTAGRTVAEAIRAYGLDPLRIADARAEGDLLGYVELHIEQGPVLDRLGIPLGIVDTIAGQTRADVLFTGSAGHAGTTPMTARRDALTGAAEWIATVEQEARATSALVATVGRVDAYPGAANVIAGRLAATLDVRHACDEVRRAAVQRLAEHARAIAARRGLEMTWTPRIEQPAVRMDPALAQALERALVRAGVPPHRLSSGAGHDAMIVARVMPAAMLFLRTPGGLSHHPDESVREADVAIALVAARYLLDELARPLS